MNGSVSESDGPSPLASSPSPRDSQPRVRAFILILSLVAAARVLVMSAAYPPFVYIDESLHYENVTKYARVGLPGRGDDRYDAATARTVHTIGIHGAGSQAALTPEQREAAIEKSVATFAAARNCETFSPPLYYALAAAWLRAGEAIGFGPVALFYWLRFLAAPLYAAAVWFGCLAALRFHPARPQIAIAAGVILAALPQDILYTINSDVASPLAGAVALYLLVRWMMSAEGSLPLAIGGGLATAAAVLVKYSNVGALALFVVAAMLRLHRSRGAAVAEIAVAFACAAGPIAAWMAYCQAVTGDWTGVRDKAEMLGWTPLALAQSLRHPIFTPLGVQEFLGRLCVTFWRGEIVWGAAVQRVAGVDRFYIVVTALGAIGTLGWLIRPSAASRNERLPAVAYVIAIVAPVAFLALVSTRFDYGRCFFPSRGFPYFAAGRLLTGAIVPFAILLAGALAELLAFTKRRYACVVAATLIAALCVGSEAYLCYSAPSSVFASPYNFYHRGFAGDASASAPR
jgi:hypothetical protein